MALNSLRQVASAALVPLWGGSGAAADRDPTVAADGDAPPEDTETLRTVCIDEPSFRLDSLPGLTPEDLARRPVSRFELLYNAPALRTAMSNQLQQGSSDALLTERIVRFAVELDRERYPSVDEFNFLPQRIVADWTFTNRGHRDGVAVHAMESMMEVQLVSLGEPNARGVAPVVRTWFGANTYLHNSTDAVSDVVFLPGTAESRTNVTLYETQADGLKMAMAFVPLKHFARPVDTPSTSRAFTLALDRVSPNRTVRIRDAQDLVTLMTAIRYADPTRDVLHDGRIECPAANVRDTAIYMLTGLNKPDYLMDTRRLALRISARSSLARLIEAETVHFELRVRVEGKALQALLQ